MANIKITELNETLTKTSNDVLPIVDITANETKKIKIENLLDKNIELLAVSDTAPSECNTGDKYYNTSTKLIYTATAQDTWSETGTTPISGILYIVYNDQASYSWDGTDLVSVGGGKEDIVIDDEEPTDPDVKLWIDTGEVGSQASELPLVYPVGSIYMSVNSTNPATLFGFGTWEAWGSGRVPVGVDTTQTEFNTVEKTGGSKELQGHSHILNGFNQYPDGTGGSYSGSQKLGVTTDGADGARNITTDNAGTGNSGNLQPYITCYMWKRTA